MHTSQAATTMTMIAKICPSPLPHIRAKAMSAMLAALSMSSRQSRITSGLRRVSTPAAPIEKISALTTRYQSRLTSRPRGLTAPVRAGSPPPGPSSSGSRELCPPTASAIVPTPGGSLKSMTATRSASSAPMPPRRRARTTAPTAAMSSRNDATSKGSRNFVSSSSPMRSGLPKVASTVGPSLESAFSPEPSTAMASSTNSARPKSTASRAVRG